MHLRTTILVLCAAATASAQHPDLHYRFAVQGPLSDSQRQALVQEFGMDECGMPHHLPFELQVPGPQLAAFGDLGLNATLLPQSGLAGGPLAAAAPPPSQYFTTAEVVQEIDAVVTAFPAIARRVDLTALPGGAVTHNGQAIWALKLSDNVQDDEDEPAMVFAAQHHAREVNSTYMVIGAMNRVARAYGVNQLLTQVVDGYELYFVPCVNPDGVDHVWNVNTNWRKNRRNNGNGTFGVDLNRNYPFLWGLCGASSNTGSDTYKGPSPASEQETQTMRALWRFTRPEVYIDFHSYGREVLFLYPPCATVSSPIRTMANFYINDLRNPMSYATRNPSASGEAPHDSWAEGGAMSLLIEVGTSFQPAFSSTVTEEARVWPGVERVLTTWRPSVTGHVTSIFQNQPIEANVLYSPSVFSHGELSKSRPRDGRYALWLPLGTHQVTFLAPGFQPRTETVTVTARNATQALEVELVPAGVQPATLTAQGTNQVGTTTTLTYASPGDAGAGYWVTLSSGNAPGLTIGSRTIPLNPDGLMLLMTQPVNGLLSNHIGFLPASETAVASFALPNIPALAGLTLYSGGITIDAQYNFAVVKFSPSVAITFQP